MTNGGPSEGPSLVGPRSRVKGRDRDRDVPGDRVHHQTEDGTSHRESLVLSDSWSVSEKVNDLYSLTYEPRTILLTFVLEGG